jgi:hypothetical protein
MRKYDLPYGLYFLFAEAAGQAFLLDVYREIRGGRGTYPIMSLCGAGVYFLSMHFGKTIYDLGHSTQGSEGSDYAPSIRDQALYRISEARASRLSADAPEDAATLRARASTVFHNADKYSFPLRAALIASYAAKATVGAAVARQRGDSWLKAFAYGAALPSAVIYEDLKSN